MNRRALIVLSFFYYCLSLQGQMITTDPAIPVTGKTIRIYFNSSDQSVTELKNFTGDLYAHTGVTINGVAWKNVIGTWGNNTLQPKLKYLGNYQYELDITPDIKTFYGLQTSDAVTRICLVIRNADGSKQTRPDIFIDVFQQKLNATFIIPQNSSFVSELNKPVIVKAAATLADSVSLYINNVFIKSGITSELLTDTIIPDKYGEYTVKAVAWDKPSYAADSFFVYIRKPIVTEALPSGMKDGINYTSENSVILVLHAPYKNYVFTVGDFNGWKPCEKGYMKRTPDTERYWIEITGLVPRKEYRFQYLVDSALRIGDPYCDKVLDPDNDKFISTETYPKLISYPTDTTTGMVSVLQTAQNLYIWQNSVFQPPKKTELRVYELLIRDFIAKHDFRTLTDTLSYLADLGINAIEIMPVCEFEGNLSWGYNPIFYFAPDKYYGPKNDMKAFVDSCHKRGIAVIMDIVLNHCNGPSPFVQLYLDHYGTDQIYMKIPNPWFNASSPNPVYKWGADFNHASAATQNLVDRITSYWLTEFRIDGFRFDFTKGFTNTPGDGSSYDASRIAILKRMAYAIWSVNTNAYVILEHFAVNEEETELANYGILLWGNNNYNYAEAAMGYASDLSNASYLNRNWSVPNLVSYMESHDEERLMYKTITYGASSGTYNTKNQLTALNRMKLDALFLMGLPGPKMIWQFGELGYDISIDQGGRTSEKPIKWEYFSDAGRHKLYEFYKVMNILRKTEPVFNTGNYLTSLSATSKRIQLIGSENKVVILGNFDINYANINPSFPVTGKWYEFFTGDSVSVTNSNLNLFFQPGEYRLYSTKKLPSMNKLLPVEKLYPDLYGNFVTAYPNPSNGSFSFRFNTITSEPATIRIYDMAGRMIKHIKTIIIPGNDEVVSWDGTAENGSPSGKGLYLVQVNTPGITRTIKILKI